MKSLINRVIVKVGNTSNLIFRNAKAYRAITIKELDKLMEIYPDTNILIIENIKESEYDRLKYFIQNHRDKVNIYFHVPDNNDTTCGLADELIYPIFISNESLFMAIKSDTGLNLSNDVTKNIISGGQNLGIDTFDSAFDQSFDTTIEIIDEYRNKIKTEEIVLPTISNKDDIESFKVIDDEITETTCESGIKQDENTEDIVIKSDDILILKYNNMERERNSLKEQLESAMDRIQHITELNEAIADERDTIKSMVESFGDSNEIIEEPISLLEYTDMKNKLDTLVSENKKLKAKIGDNESQIVKLDKESSTKKIIEERVKALENDCVKYKKKIDSLKDELSKKDTVINDLTNNCNNLKLEIETINSTIDENKLVEAKEEIETLNNNIDILEAKIASSDSELVSINKELLASRESISKNIDDLTDKITQITSLNNQITKLNEEKVVAEATIAKVNNELIDLKNKTIDYDTIKEQVIKLEETQKNNEAKIASDKVEIERLNSLVEDVEKRIELARSYMQDEVNNKTRKNIELKGKLDIITAQLVAKEIEYNELVKSTGVDTGGASNILENSKIIGEINNTLRLQIADLERDIERIGKEKDFLYKNSQAINDQNKQLTISVKAMSSSMTGSGSSNLIPPLNYTGKGMIIPVLGCGSFGITTTAMSLAANLSTKSKVLYIDFDMVNPKADAWFKFNPIIKSIPGYSKADIKNSGLGIFIDKQFQYFLQYATSIINRVITTKGGSIDYLSGFYAKPDMIKLISADFTSLLNYCGNNYTYIIIDFGKLGCSDINDQIIKTVTDISYKSVVVTTSEKLEMRTFRLKINEAGININNIAWLINMCKSTKLDQTAKKAISPAKYSMMPLNMGMYGNIVDFTSEKNTRDKLKLFMDEVLFNN